MVASMKRNGTFDFARAGALVCGQTNAVLLVTTTADATMKLRSLT